VIISTRIIRTSVSLPSDNRSHIMLISFQHNDPLASIIVDASTRTRTPRYETVTMTARGITKTTLRRAEGELTGRVVGEIEWNPTERLRTVVVSGRRSPLDTFLAKGGLFTRTKRTFVAPNGMAYTWQSAHLLSDNFVLEDRNYELVARSEVGPTRGNGKLEIHIEAGGIRIADLIVFTFIIMEQLRRERLQSHRRHHRAGMMNNNVALNNLNMMNNNMINNNF